MRLDIHGPHVVIQSGHRCGAATLRLERIETVKGPDVENSLSSDIRNAKALELSALHVSALLPRRSDPVTDVDGVKPKRHRLNEPPNLLLRNALHSETLSSPLGGKVAHQMPVPLGSPRPWCAG